MLTCNGAYFYHNPETKYQGLYFPEKKDENNWTLFKTIEEISFNKEDKALVNNFTNVKRFTDNGQIEYSFMNNALIIKTNVKGKITITLDMREIHDFDDKGRIYNISEEKGCVLVEYKKFYDNILEKINYTRYLAIKTDIKNMQKIMQWTEAYYKEDEHRKSQPFKLHVFTAFTLKCNRQSKIVITYSKDKEKVLNNAKDNFEAEEDIYKINKIKTDDEKILAYNCALKSIDDLYVKFDNIDGYYAGLPWFFQFWTRDEAISLIAPLLQEKYDLVKHILLSRIKAVQEDGRIPNRVPNSELETADGTAWVFKRIYDLLLTLKEKNKPIEEYLSQNDLYFIKEQLKKSIKAQKKNYSQDLLIKNDINETWMDTNYQDNGRKGFKIEIQALWLSMLKLINYLDSLLKQQPEYKELEQQTKSKVKELFFDGNILKDGKDDPTIRPNIFLAYYVYPEVLEKEEWEKVFDNSLKKLWLDWGGLTTIPKDSPLFCSNYSGEDTKSYHRGDSWFFINNIAALSLLKLNKNKYKNYIEKIINASTTDILYNGVIGRPSELSSASELKGEASIFQLWSAATYIELLRFYQTV